MQKIYTIEINPIAWQRAGVKTSQEYKPKFYDKQTHEKLAYGLHLQKQHGTSPLFSGPIEADIIFYMPISKTVSKRPNCHYHSKRPDIDNLLKYLFDAANNVIFKDDAIVSKLSVQKLYDRQPRTVICIKDLE